MMYLLVVIYLAFISLGLPDSLLGSSWPAMRLALDAPLSMAGVVQMVCAGGTILSSLMSARLIRRFKTGPVTLVSVAMTAVALLGMSFVTQPWMLFALAVPLGLGAGSVDAALNNYVALHYEARHMSWLHCFWGIGATMGPIILSRFLAQGNNWRGGYLCVACIQAALVVVLIAAQPRWRKAELTDITELAASQKPMSNLEASRLPGIRWALLTFLCYCGMEACAGLWTASFLTEQRGFTAETAAFWGSMFYLGITAGRGVCGFLTMKVKSRDLIRAGEVLILLGGLSIALPLGGWSDFAGILLIGLGCAPVYPCTIHETPHRFGAAASQAAMGLQMATAYVGSTFMPSILGLVAGKVGLQIFPYVLLGMGTLLLIGSELTEKRCSVSKK